MRKPFNASAIVIVLALIYFFGLIGGLYVISYLPGGWMRSDLEFYAAPRVAEYKKTGRVNNWSNGGMAAVIYDTDGKFEDFFHMGGQSFPGIFVEQTEEMVPAVLSGEATLKTFPFVRDYSKRGYTTFIHVGVPIVEKGELMGAFFWVKESPDLAEIMIGYMIIFSLFFTIVVAFLLHNLRMQRRYEAVRKRYVDNITHEMKSPIASIKALAEALTDGMGKDESERNIYYGMIIGEANHQERMILDALTLAKLQTSLSRPQRKPISAESVFAPVCQKNAVLCEVSGVSFRVEDSIRNLPVLYSDADMLRRVLETLLGNARKFVQEDGTITLSAKVQRKRVTICVSDDGVGIPPNDRAYVFERFYKGGQKCNETGSGLGLAIAKETLVALKEKIWFQSEEGKGTSIYFTISRP